MGLGDTFGYFDYNSDDGTTYVIKLSTAVATAGGFSAASGGPIGGTNTVWPWHESDMRHVTGRDGSGHRARCPIASPSNTLFQSGGTFTIHSRGYVVTGAEGERRVANHVR